MWLVFTEMMHDSWWTVVYDNPLSVWCPVYRRQSSARSLLASLFWRVSTKPALQRTQDTSPVSKGNRFLQCLSLSPVRPGPGRLCFHGRAGPGLTAQSAQAIIRLFQGYAVIMEWAAYRDSRKADWELIGRGKTSRKRCSVPAYLFNLSKWLER